MGRLQIMATQLRKHPGKANQEIFIKALESAKTSEILEDYHAVMIEPTVGINRVLELAKNGTLIKQEDSVLESMMVRMNNTLVQMSQDGYPNHEHWEKINESAGVIYQHLNKDKLSMIPVYEMMVSIYGDDFGQPIPMSVIKDIREANTIVAESCVGVTEAASINTTNLHDQFESSMIEEFENSPGAIIKYVTRCVNDREYQKYGSAYHEFMIGILSKIKERIEISDPDKSLSPGFYQTTMRLTNSIIEDLSYRAQFTNQLNDTLINSLRGISNACFAKVPEALRFQTINYHSPQYFSDVSNTPTILMQASDQHDVDFAERNALGTALKLLSTGYNESDSDAVVAAPVVEYMIAQANYDAVTEANGERMAKVSHAIDRAGEKALHGARKVGGGVKRSTVALSRVPKRVANQVSKMLDNLESKNYEARRELIIKGGYRQRLGRVVRVAITTGTVSGIALATGGAPIILGAIAMLTSIAVDKKIDRSARVQVLEELEDELKMVNEKVEDARSGGGGYDRDSKTKDKQDKYQLLRIKHQLEKDILRIKYNLGGRANRDIPAQQPGGGR